MLPPAIYRVTLYVFVIPVAFIDASKSTYRPGFSTIGLNPDIPASVAYKRAFQKSTFNQLLGSTRITQTYINENSFIARGHLSPDADFLFATFQSSTYYYLNTCPQWQVINGGNWKSIEITVRNTVAKYNDTFRIITGTHEILSLPNANHNPTEIFLISGDKLPVPKYIWKIVYNENLKEGIVLIILNNPFVNVTEQDLLCENVCDKFGWGTRGWSNTNRGFVHCCDIRHFRHIVGTEPLFTVTGILRGIHNL